MFKSYTSIIQLKSIVMTNAQQAKLKMFDSVISFYKLHFDIIATIPALQAAFSKFSEITAAIHVMAAQKALDIKGVSVNKKQFRAALEKIAAAIAGILQAYARAVKDVELKGQVNYTPTNLRSMRDEELLAVCQNISNFASAKLPALASYNLTEASIEELNTAIGQFGTALPRPRYAQNQRNLYGKSLAQLIDEGIDTLENEVDNIILSLKATQPDIHSLYMSNRIIVDSPTTSTQIKGVITYNNIPIEGALITVIETGAIATTDLTGMYTLKPIPYGKYTIVITKKGFDTVTLTSVMVKRGKIKKINAVLVKSVQEK
jgi:hypothetical protein